MDEGEVLEAKEQSLSHLRGIYGDEVEVVIADARYGFIGGLTKEVLQKPAVERLTLSDIIDRVVLNRWLGIPLFLAIMLLVFQCTFTLSAPLMDWLSRGFGWLGGAASGIGGGFGSLLAEGVIGGVGTVLTFVPPIFLLFIALAVLEDCGYLARAAFVMDRLMHHIGLHGRSFVPLLLGFGCNVPAIMATRTIENPRDRLTTILINPFMSCGARLPIYVLLAAAFFTTYQGLVVFSMYLIGVIVAIITTFILRQCLLTGPSGHFVMELPPFHLPTIKGVLVHMWERGKTFLTRAGTIIFGVVVLIWLLDYTGILEPIGRAITPLFAPCGFGQWQAAVSLVFGFMAKEAVVGILGTLLASTEGFSGLGLALGLKLGWTPLIVYSMFPVWPHSALSGRRLTAGGGLPLSPSIPLW